MNAVINSSQSRAARGPQISSWCAISERCSDFTDPISRMVDRAPSEPRSILKVIHRRLSVGHVCKGGASPGNCGLGSNRRATLFAVGDPSVLLIVGAAIAGHPPSHRTVLFRLARTVCPWSHSEV